MKAGLNWEAINTISGIIGAAAIVVTLFYLVEQTRQLTEQTEQSVTISSAQEQRTLIDQFNQYLRRMIEPENLATMREILVSYRQLDKDDQAKALVLLAQWINHYEQSRYAYQAGLLPQAVLIAFERFAVAFLVTPGGSEFWQDFSDVFGAEVSQAISEVLSDPERRPPPITETYPWLLPD